MLAPPALHPVDDKLRVLDLQVKTPAGEVLDLQMPWDRSAFDLEPILVAGTRHDEPDRTVVAYPLGAETVDLLELPLGKALRHAENLDGAATVIIHVEADGSLQEFAVTCAGLREPEPHQAYPRGHGPAAGTRVAAYLASVEPEWFCDGSSTLACCAEHRDAPQDLVWVAL